MDDEELYYHSMILSLAMVDLGDSLHGPDKSSPTIHLVQDIGDALKTIDGRIRSSSLCPSLPRSPFVRRRYRCPQWEFRTAPREERHYSPYALAAVPDAQGDELEEWDRR